MLIRKQLKYITFIICLALVADIKVVFGVENSYKYSRQAARFQQSALNEFRTGLNQTIEGLEQKSDNLESMNQNLEGRVNVLSSEKDKLNKAYTQMKVKQSALEKEHAKLKKKTTSLEVAYKKLSNKSSVAANSKKTKSVAKKTSTAKTQKKTSAKSNSTGRKVTSKKASAKEKMGDSSSLQSFPPKVPEGKTYEGQKDKTIGGLDVKKVNEKGIEYGKKGMYDEAIKEFQKVAAVEPNMANVHYNLGLAYKKKGMLPDADKEFAEYERLNKQNN